MRGPAPPGGRVILSVSSSSVRVWRGGSRATLRRAQMTWSEKSVRDRGPPSVAGLRGRPAKRVSEVAAVGLGLLPASRALGV